MTQPALSGLFYCTDTNMTLENQETQSAQVDDAEAQAIAEAQAGYDGKARAQAPAQPVEPVKETALPDQPQPPASEEDPEDGTEPEAQTKPDPTAAVTQQLEDLKAQVRELKASGADAETVRKMHGDIGEINRRLKSLKALEKTDAPAEDELAAALKSAEEVALEYPELAGPLVKALKVLQARMPTGVAAAEPEKDAPTQAAPAVDQAELDRKARAEAAIQSLDEVHPDRHALKGTKEFKDWFAAKPPEYQSKVKTSWNPAVVAQCFTDYKATVAARKRKQERLEAAVTPQGLPRATPTTISDEEAARIGYERARAKRL